MHHKTSSALVWQGGTVPVQVHIPTVFRKYTDQQSHVEVEPGSVAEVVQQLDSRFPGFKLQLLDDSGELRRFVNVYVNDEDVRYLELLDTRASEGDSVSLLPSVAGG
jgi:molybdopterin synthase sulfur carrier subunit